MKNMSKNKKIIFVVLISLIIIGSVVYTISILNNLSFKFNKVSGDVSGGATIVYQSNEVGYDNTSSGMASTNVQAALDELYQKASKCPNTSFKLGDYFSLTPTASTYTVKTSTTGYTSDQTITPSELTLWRVIDIHSDESVDAVSEYGSSTNVYFQGTTGYANLVGGLQTIAAQYAKPGYTTNTRMMGYGGQTPTIADTSAFDGTNNTAPATTDTASPTTGTGEEFSGGVLGDTLYLKDYTLVSNVYKSDTTTYGSTGLKAYKVGTTTETSYWLASRSYYYGSATDFRFYYRYIGTSGGRGRSVLRSYDGYWHYFSSSFALRPIITLKSGVSVSGGSGTKTSPYTLN